MTTATTLPNQVSPGIKPIVDDYLDKAIPIITRLADIAEEVQAIMERGVVRKEHRKEQATMDRVPVPLRVKYLDRLEGFTDLVLERGPLAGALPALERKTRRTLERWYQEREQALVRARAYDPEADTSEGREKRLLAMAKADELSVLPGTELVAEARRLLAADEPEEAMIRVKAARLTDSRISIGRDRAGRADLPELTRRIERAIDQRVPHRKAASAQLKQDTADYRHALNLIVMPGTLATMLARATPSDPSREVETVREWVSEVTDA